MNSPARKVPLRILLAIVMVASIWAGSGSVWAQNRYDDHDPQDRFYITLGAFAQNELRTTIRIDAKTPAGGIAAGTVIGLESLFDVDDKLATARLDGWYRFNKRHRIGWTYWRTNREGLSTYNATESIVIGDVVIEPGASIATDDNSQLMAASWSYSFINTSKYEAWLGTGLNFQNIDTTIDITLTPGANPTQFEESAKATVPIPTINFGGRYNFGKRWRMLLMQQLFGLKIGDFEGKLNNTRFLAEVNITKNFGLGGGFERFSFEVNAEGDKFAGELDTSYTAFSLYLKGQL